jgi:hypothetical protein
MVLGLALANSSQTTNQAVNWPNFQVANSAFIPKPPAATRNGLVLQSGRHAGRSSIKYRFSNWKAQGNLPRADEKEKPKEKISRDSPIFPRFTGGYCILCAMETVEPAPAPHALGQARDNPSVDGIELEHSIGEKAVACPGRHMDGNYDRVPCERQWCTSPFANGARTPYPLRADLPCAQKDWNEFAKTGTNIGEPIRRDPRH